MNSDTRIRDNTRVLIHKTPVPVTSSSHHKPPLPPHHTTPHTTHHSTPRSSTRIHCLRSVSNTHVACITAPLYHSTTAPLHHCTTAPLHHCTTALYHSTTVSQHHSTTVSLHLCINESLHLCTTVSLHPLYASMKPQRRRSRTNSQHLHYVFIMLGGYR